MDVSYSTDDSFGALRIAEAIGKDDLEDYWNSFKTRFDDFTKGRS